VEVVSPSSGAAGERECSGASRTQYSHVDDQRPERGRTVSRYTNLYDNVPLPQYTSIHAPIHPQPHPQEHRHSDLLPRRSPIREPHIPLQ